MTSALCGKSTSRDTPCRTPRMPRFDGCVHHRTVTQDALLIEAARDRMRYQNCEELHSPRAELARTEWWLDELDALKEWIRQLAPHAKPVCWEWDASDGTLTSIREAVMQDRRERAPAGIAKSALARDLDWEVFIVWHDYRCAWCGRVGELQVDHDHQTRLIRGLLCAGCNLHEGQYSAYKNARGRSCYHCSAPSHAADRYRTKNPATLLGLERKYSRKNVFPRWSQLAERVPIGAAPPGHQEPPLIVPGSLAEQFRAEVEASRLATRAQRDLEMAVRAMQKSTGRFSCTTCPSWHGISDFRTLEPVVTWVREQFPGVHERVATRMLDELEQLFGPTTR